MTDGLLTIKETAKILGVSVRTVARLRTSGRLASVKVGWFRFYRLADVEALKGAK